MHHTRNFVHKNHKNEPYSCLKALTCMDCQGVAASLELSCRILSSIPIFVPSIHPTQTLGAQTLGAMKKTHTVSKKIEIRPGIKA